jgi:hypothetical protein
MQTIIHIVSNRTNSLRDRVASHARLEHFELYTAEHKRPGRPSGWAKLHSYEADGAINLKWDAPSRMLICRIVTKLAGRPHRITGDFIAFLLAHFRREIRAINIIPQ